MAGDQVEILRVVGVAAAVAAVAAWFIPLLIRLQLVQIIQSPWEREELAFPMAVVMESEVIMAAIRFLEL